MSFILLTGGAGYVGVHCVVELVNSGYNLVIVDNLCNASAESLKRAEQITGKKSPFSLCRSPRQKSLVRNILDIQDFIGDSLRRA